MSDTATQAPTDTGPAKRTTKPRNVEYTLEVVDDLPEQEVKRRSPLNDKITELISFVGETPSAKGKFICIAKYDNTTAASAAANVLRQRHGDSQAVEGFHFQTARIDENGTPKTGLFVKYDPDQVVDGAKADWERRETERKATIEANRKAREAEKNATQPGGAATPTPTQPGQTVEGGSVPATQPAPSNGGNVATGNVNPAATQAPNSPGAAGSKTGAGADKAQGTAAAAKR